MLTPTACEGPFELLEWDSRHFGFLIGAVHAGGRGSSPEAIAAWRERHHVDCLYWRIPIDDLASLRSAEAAGFRLVDLRVTLKNSSIPLAEPSSDDVRPYRPEDLPELRDMAGTLHRDSRFFCDARFPEQKSRELFEIWMEKACRQQDGWVLVAEMNGRPAGYICCENRGTGTGRIQLLGVHPSAQGRGIGGRLIDAALAVWSRQPGFVVDVITQGRNLPGQRLYQRHGFVTVAQELWYHWWRPAEAR